MRVVKILVMLWLMELWLDLQALDWMEVPTWEDFKHLEVVGLVFDIPA